MFGVDSQPSFRVMDSLGRIGSCAHRPTGWGRREAVMRVCELRVMVLRSVTEPRAGATIHTALKTSFLYAGFMRRS
jgi:hypothetical protein